MKTIAGQINNFSPDLNTCKDLNDALDIFFGIYTHMVALVALFNSHPTQVPLQDGNNTEFNLAT